jgi:hypothetical protein
MGYPGSPHLWHVAGNVCGYRGDQQKKCSAKSDVESDPHRELLPYYYPRCASTVGRVIGVASEGLVRWPINLNIEKT